MATLEGKRMIDLSSGDIIFCSAETHNDQVMLYAGEFLYDEERNRGELLIVDV